MSFRHAATALLLAAVACKGSTDSAAGARITLRGTLAGALLARGGGAGAPATLVQATQVVVVYVSGPPQVAVITNGAFAVQVRRGSPAGMIFADASNVVVGYLSLGNGIASLPLSVASDTLTAIDFQTLSASGIVLTPAHDPLGAELPMSPADIAALAQTNAYFAEVVQNSDADGDGMVDALSGRYYWLDPVFFFNGGTFDASTPAATMILPINVNCTRLALWAFDPAAPPSVTFQFPNGGLDGSFLAQSGAVNNYGSNSCSPQPPPAGLYHVTFGAKTLSFTLPDPALALARMIVPVPTVSIAGGTLTAIDWSYRTSSDPAIVDPARLLDQPIVLVKGYDGSGTNTVLWQSGAGNTVWPASTTHMAITPSLAWSKITEIDMGYIDSYGTQTNFQFPRPSGAP